MNFFALLLHKPIGITSFSAVSRVKNVVNAIIKPNVSHLTQKEKRKTELKAGHTGTLDKHASGLLIVLFGRATRLSNFFLRCDKKYKATFYLGKETDTLDSDGRCITEMDLPTQDMFRKTFADFRGDLEQRPPRYSALHIDGTRAYKRARNNEDVEMPLRKITIYDSKIITYDEPQVLCDFHVSSGTYIRSLVRDIARAAGSVAYMSALERTDIAGINLSDALSLEKLETLGIGDLTKICVPADKLLQKIIQADIINLKNNTVREELFFGKVPECVIHYKQDSQDIKHMFLYDTKGFLAFYTRLEENQKWKLIVHTAA